MDGNLACTPVTIKPTVSQYIQSCSAIPEKSRRTYLGRLAKFLADPAVANLPLDELTHEIIRARLTAMARGGEFSVATCHGFNNVAAHLRAVLEAARREGLIASNPAAGVRISSTKSTRPLFEVLKAAQVGRS